MGPRGGRLPPGPLARGGLTAGLGLLLALGLPQGDLRLLADPARAVALRQPEALLLALIGLLLLLLLLLPQALLALPGRLLRPLRGAGRLLPAGLLLLGLGAGAVEAAADGWRAAGVDWHDSYLGAYALLHGDLVFYAPYRFPLYPALGGALSRALGLPLPQALQLLSLVALAGIAVPVAILGRARLGVGPTLAAAACALGLPSLQVNAHAVTPYPLFAGAFALLLWGLVEAAGGRLRGWALGGAGAALVFLADVKGLLPGLVGLGLLLALLPALRARPGRRLGALVLALALGLGPTGAAHGWMAGLPVIPLSLEEHSARVLEDGRLASAASSGTVFGQLRGPLQPIHALMDVQRALSAPERAERVAQHRAGSLQRLRRDFPGLTWRSLALAGLGLLLPLRGPRLRGFLGGAVALLLLATTAGLAGLEYQERYVLHAAPWVILGLVGGLCAGSGALLAAARGEVARPAAGLMGALVVVFALAWPGSPLALGRGEGARLDPSTGGGGEQALAAWSAGALRPDDLLLDTTWMMSGVLLLGHHAVARVPGDYPSLGVPFPQGRWRVSRPWPAEGGRRLALVGRRPAPPNQVRRAETNAGQRILDDQSWAPIWESARGELVVLEHRGAEAPAWWLPGGLSGPSAHGRR
jgi:hypothetical protein